jgi:hypothetical protein
VIRQPDEHGIEGINSDNVQIHGNTIVDLGMAAADSYDGINLDSTSDRFFVHGNEIIPSATTDARYIVSASGANGVVDNNIWSIDGATGSLSVTADDSTTRSNRKMGGEAGFLSGTGSPEGTISANTGSIYLRTDGSGSDEGQYSKITGTGTSGWYANTESGLSSLA